MFILAFFFYTPPILSYANHCYLGALGGIFRGINLTLTLDAPTATDKLTDKAIRAAKTKPKDYKLADGGGMYLLVRQSGAKYWRLKYRFAGKEKTLALGVYCDQSGKVTGDNIKLAKARKLRDEAKILIKEGIDPSLERKKSANALHQKHLTTFEAVAHDRHGGKSSR